MIAIPIDHIAVMGIDKKRQIVIFSQEYDIHALAILSGLKKYKGVEAHFVPTDALITLGGIRWSSRASSSAEIKTIEGLWIAVDTIDLIWWRRVNNPQKSVENLPDGELKDFINNEWRAALLGILHDRFKGIWVNDPIKDALAGNKLYQLSKAKECGFRVPETLVTQDYDALKEFNFAFSCIVAKKLMGTRHAPLATIDISEFELERSSVEVCPAIYQERINTTKHLRVNCFGDEAHNLLIQSKILDWRRDMSQPIVSYKLDKSIETKLFKLLKKLGLEMGVFDLMLIDNDDPIWIELNTQGQFLFGEGLAGYDLTNPFCNFLNDRSASNVVL